MFVGVCQMTLHIPTSGSLKDKRQVIRSILQRVRNQFDISAAEVDHQDTWQLATLGFACVSADAQHAQDILDNAVRYIEASRPDVDVTVVEMDVIPV